MAGLGESKRVRGASWLALALIAVGTALRLFAPSTIEFKQDEVTALDLGISLIDEHPWSSDRAWPRHGMLSSNYVANAPLFNSIMAVLWAVTDNVAGATALVAAANAVALVPFWFWARRRLGDKRGLLSLALVAVSPFAVLFSRKLWAQDLLFPGLVLLLWAVEWLRGGRRWLGSILGALALLVVGQLHQSGLIALALLPFAFLAQAIVDRRNRSAPAPWGRPSAGEAVMLLAAIALNLFFWLPYVEYLFGLAPGVLSTRPTTGCCSPALFRELAEQLMPRDLFYFFDRDDFMSSVTHRSVFYVAVGLGAAASLYGFWRWLISPFSVPVLGIWWWMVIVFFTVARIPTYPFYVLILAPLPALLVAGAFDGPLAHRRLQRALDVVRWTYVLALTCLTIAISSWLQDRGGSPGDFGVTYGVREEQARAALLQLASGPSAAPGEARTAAGVDGPSALRCRDLPMELIWLMQRVDRTRSTFEGLELCDGWREENGRLRYRWAIVAGGKR